MKVAREGMPFILIAVLLAAGAWSLGVQHGSIPWLVLAGALTIVAGWVMYFFRDPERTGDRGANLVISPADGRVVMIADVDEPSFVHGKATRISIFMNIFNVHVNRYPVSGTVKYVQYNPGKFLHAAAEKASLDNEQMSVGLETGGRLVLVRQIAGAIARRIVTYSKVGDTATQADRFGLIRFGSRVDVFVPTNSKVRVTIGEKPVAGTTVLAELS
ncbi:MAG TPA: phosphatidylserine decarboxylase family protein [Gemmatimonadaceae bacterium]|nr:phosphatidylserine decarboxylase family protein [Gemmatimonadaceae bacterium]